MRGAGDQEGSEQEDQRAHRALEAWRAAAAQTFHWGWTSTDSSLISPWRAS